jgi:hypothetical protein
MNTHDLRKKINRALQKEDRSKILIKHLEKSLAKKDAETSFNFITGYVTHTPDIMDSVYTAAQSAGVLDQFQPVFDAVFNYWNEEYDVIPDKNGLSGLTDDAYLSLCLMQKIANSKMQGSSSVLIKLELDNANKLMRNLFGTNVANILDKMVQDVFSSSQFQNQLLALLNNPLLLLGLPGFSTQNVGNVNPQFWKYQQQMSDMDNIYRQKSDLMQGQLMGMAANAGFTYP